jgi:glutathione synthase/RimK-type ligase-like ATP-grasp enzyme
MFYIYAYNMFSEGAGELREALDARLIKHQNSRFQPGRGKIVINWGSSQCPYEAVNRDPRPAQNKLLTFNRLDGQVDIPAYTTSRVRAQEWLATGNTVLARQRLSSHSGRGIVVVNPGDNLPEAPLYVLYVKKKKEFRVHVLFGNVIQVQEKRKRNGTEHNPIRSHDNGYVYCFEGIVEPDRLRHSATQAVQALGLDFGAVDIIWNERQNRCYVLEVNTAPGICPTSARAYAEAFRAHFA